MTGGIELGGTTTVVAVGSAEGTISAQHRLPTTGAEATLGAALTWLGNQDAISSLGVAAFGPVGIAPERSDHGRVLATPKPGWSGFDILATLHRELGDLPVTLDTDVNAAAIAEHRLGAGQGTANLSYITIGTGIGGATIANGELLKGALHSELGHLKVPRHPEDAFPGVCPAHGDCLEGLASGTALAGRWGKDPAELPGSHQAWVIEAWYLAHGILALLAIACPARVIIGGGVSQSGGLHARVEARLRELAGGYFTPLNENSPFVVAPALGQDAGVVGALLLGS